MELKLTQRDCGFLLSTQGSFTFILRMYNSGFDESVYLTSYHEHQHEPGISTRTSTNLLRTSEVMPMKNGKIVPDYKLVDNLRIRACYSDKCIRDTIHHKPKPGDVFLCAYQKCGSNWTQQILMLLVNDAKPSTDSKAYLTKCPFLEFTGVDALEGLPEPRLAKVHLPFNLAPFSPDAKYVFVARNPKDCVVSFYHHTRSGVYDYKDGKFEDFFELFLNGEVDYGDYFDHVLSWYQQRHRPNVLFLYYEEMKKDIKSAIIRIANFLGPKYQGMIEDPQKLSDIIYYSSFDYMKKHLNDDSTEFFDLVVNPEIDIEKLTFPSGIKYVMRYFRNKKSEKISDLKFVRKGIIGDWRANFTEDQNKRMNAKIELKLKGTEMLQYWKSIGCI